jgi:RNA polymerase sigma factor (TIGR02999 family)
MPDTPASDNKESMDSEDLYEEIYNELRTLSHSLMSREYLYSTLQGTALVHEAWLRLGAENQTQWQNKRHLFAAASEAMRRILVERARKRSRQKYGGEFKRAPEEEMLKLGEEIRIGDEFVRISEALEKFASVDPQKAELVRLRYFFGLSFEEAAELMNISLSTAKRWWVFSRSWLHREMSDE